MDSGAKRTVQATPETKETNFAALAMPLRPVGAGGKRMKQNGHAHEIALPQSLPRLDLAAGHLRRSLQRQGFSFAAESRRTGLANTANAGKESNVMCLDVNRNFVSTSAMGRVRPKPSSDAAFGSPEAEGLRRLRMQTHSSRILSCDLERDEDAWPTEPKSSHHENTSDADERRVTGRIVTAAVVAFAIFAFAYFAAAGGIQMLESPDAPTVSVPGNLLSTNQLAHEDDHARIPAIR